MCMCVGSVECMCVSLCFCLCFWLYVLVCFWYDEGNGPINRKKWRRLMRDCVIVYMWGGGGG